MRLDMSMQLVEQFKFEISTITAMAMILLLLPYGFALESYVSNKNKPPSASRLVAEIGPVENAVDTSPLPASPTSNENETRWPMHGRVTAEYGVPHHPWQRHHSGIDIASSHPSSVATIVAYKKGIVSEVNYSRAGYGNHIIINHGEDMISLYAHLSSISVQKGQHVRAGDSLGIEGRSGIATGPHLHFEIRVNGNLVNPRHIIPGNP